MPEVKISALPAAGTLDGTEKFPIVQGGVTKAGLSGAFVRVNEGPLYAKSKAVTAAQYDVVGNGVAKPLSDYYASLGAAQAAYPHAVALTDQLDWAVLQLALDALPTATGSTEMTLAEGGEVKLTPSSRWMTNRGLSLRDGNVLSGSGASSAITTITGFADSAAITNVKDSGVNYTWRQAIKSLRINTQANGAWRGILLTNALYAVLDDLFIDQFGLAGLESVGTHGLDLRHVYLTGNGQNAAGVAQVVMAGNATSPTTSMTMLGGAIRASSKEGLRADKNFGSSRILGTVIEGNTGGPGVHLRGSSHVYLNAYMEGGNGSYDVLVEADTDGTIADSVIIDATNSSGSEVTHAYKFDGDRDCVVINCRDTRTDKAGIERTANSRRLRIVGGVQFAETLAGTSFGHRDTLFDDFVGSALSSIWTQGGTGGTGAMQSITSGAYRLSTGAADGNGSSLSWNGKAALDPAKSFVVETRVRVNQITDCNPRPIRLLGPADDLIVSVAAGNWQVTANNSGTSETLPTGVALTTAWTTFLLEVESARYRLFIDGILRVTGTVGIPNEAMEYTALITTSAAADKTMDIDFVRIAADR